MPRQNFIAILCTSVISLLCYQRVEHEPYGRYFAEALERIHGDALVKVQRQPLFDAAVSGMTSLLDEHSQFITRAKTPVYLGQLDQHFTGIGIKIEYDRRQERILIADAVIGTPRPAYDAGMRAGDQLLAIEGKSVTGPDMEKALGLIKGPAGTPVRLKVLHAGQTEPAEFKVVREKIIVDSVMGDVREPDGTWRYLLPTEPPVPYLRIESFGAETPAQLQGALELLKKHGQLWGLIIDVRDDGGGYLESAIKVCDLFIDKGVIVSVHSPPDEATDRESIEVHRATGQGTYLGFPMAVLVNGESASASEIFAACLQDHHRAVVVGSRSYGKGMVEKMFFLEMGQSILKLTTATYWRPSGKNIHRMKGAKPKDEWGVWPDKDLGVELTKEQEADRRRARQQRDVYRGNAAAEPLKALDPQLARAVKYIQSQLADGAKK